jgi:hypothetical protein
VLNIINKRLQGVFVKYPEYLSSAKRHNHTCRVLKAKIDSFDIAEHNSEEFNFLVYNLYYLSGYVIECSMKFKIFELEQYSSNAEVDEVECKKAGIDYKKRIKTHNFQRLQNYLDSLISGLSHSSGKTEINKLLNDWKPELRYSHFELNFSHIEEFHNHVSKYLQRM